MDKQTSKFHIPKIPTMIWVQLLLLAVGYAFYSANRLSFGVGLKAMAAQLAMTPIQVGTIGTIFTLGQAVIDIPAGYLADRFGRKRLLVSSMVLLGIMTAVVTKANDVIQVGIARTLFGMAEGMWNIVMYSVAGSIFPAARAMLNGLMMTFYSIGAYVGPCTMAIAYPLQAIGQSVSLTWALLPSHSAYCCSLGSVKNTPTSLPM